MEEIFKSLEDLGMKKRQTKIYLSLIKGDSKTALEISRETNIDRTTIYDLINKMEKEGIVSSFKRNNSTYFKVLSVDKLVLHFREKINSLKSVSEKLKKLEMKEKNDFECETFSGIEGLKTVIRDLIDSRKDYKVIGIKKKYEELLNYFHDSGLLKIKNTNVLEEAIVQKGETFTKIKKGKYHFLKEGLESESTTIIYGSTVLFFIWKEPYFALRVKNFEFSKSQEEYFDLILKSAR